MIIVKKKGEIFALVEGRWASKFYAERKVTLENPDNYRGSQSFGDLKTR